MKTILEWLDEYSNKQPSKCKECVFDLYDHHTHECVIKNKTIKVEKPEWCPLQEAVTGRWVKMTGMMPAAYQGHYECSNCKWHGHRDLESDYKFCPNCGIKMALTQEKEKNENI